MEEAVVHNHRVRCCRFCAPCVSEVSQDDARRTHNGRPQELMRFISGRAAAKSTLLTLRLVNRQRREHCVGAGDASAKLALREVTVSLAPPPCTRRVTHTGIDLDLEVPSKPPRA
eukprot:4378031-Pyramimonas_sp.AAC.1